VTETPEVRSPGANVPGYLLPLSILVTLFCCLPVGILAIVFSVQARSKSQAGNYAGASQAVRRANISLIAAVVLGILTIILAVSLGFLGIILGAVSEQSGTATGGGGTTTARGTEEEGPLRDIIPERVGDFELQSVEDFPEGLQAGAQEALTATYQSRDGDPLTYNVLDMSSPEEADDLQQQQVQIEQEELGLQVVSEEPFEDEYGDETGTVTVLEEEIGESTVTTVLWSEDNLYEEVVAEEDAALDFYEELPY
jgi:Interferon-induced transmembrane protein